MVIFFSKVNTEYVTSLHDDTHVIKAQIYNFEVNSCRLGNLHGNTHHRCLDNFGNNEVWHEEGEIVLIEFTRRATYAQGAIILLVSLGEGW